MAYKCPTAGMQPTITSNDLIVANPFAYSSEDVKRFDIVIFKAPDEVSKRFGDKGSRLVQRVIALPNETIEIRNNQVFIDGVLLDEPFERILDEKDFKKDFKRIVIPQDEYFLIGDNRPNSEDSRYYSHPTINKKDIYSKVIDIKKGFYKQD